MDLYFLDHLCFFWTLGIINNDITEKSIYFENRPAIILNKCTGIFVKTFCNENKTFWVIINYYKVVGYIILFIRSVYAY